MLFQSLLDLFYPRICPGCAQTINQSEAVICFSCHEKLPFCPYLPHQTHPIEKMFWGRVNVHVAASLLVFGKLGIGQKLLHQVKYKGNKELGQYLGHLLGHHLNTYNQIKTAQAIIPVPLFKKKQHERGYNQSEVIAQGISGVLQIPVLNNYLIRQINTSTQTKKNRLERVDNVSGAFQIIQCPTARQYQHVLLLDDVVTTGSTLEACVNVLTPHHQVSIATLAYQ